MVQLHNFVESGTKVADSAPVYAYESGTKATWLSNAQFAGGTYASTESNNAQPAVSAQVLNGVVSIRQRGEGVAGTADWSTPINLTNMANATRVSVASSNAGLKAVAVITSTPQILVARQLAPDVWGSSVAWTTLPSVTAANDLEIVFRPNGLLTMVYTDASQVTFVIDETAVGTWGTATNLGGVAPKSSIAIYPNGDVIEWAIGSSNKSLFYRLRSGPTWGAWASVCTSATAYTDFSATVVGGKSVVYVAHPTGIFLCSENAGVYTLSSVYTSATAVSSIGAAGRADGRVLLMASIGGVQSTALQPTTGTAPTFTALTGTYSDMEVDVSPIGTGVSAALTPSGYAMSGTWTSATFDTGATGSGIYGMLRSAVSLPAGTSLTFQVAAAASGTPANFIGPDGTAATSFPSTGGAMPYAVDGLRYFRVKATFTGTTTASATLIHLTVNYHLARTARSVGGTYSVTAPADPTAWTVRMSTPDAAVSAATTKLTDSGSTWGAGTSFGASLANSAPQCCAPAQFNVVSGASTPTGAAGTAMATSGGRVGQSVILSRSTLTTGTGSIRARHSLSSSLLVDWPLSVTLKSNLAVGGSATQKSDYLPPSATASVAIDGNSDGTFGNGSVTHTKTPGQSAVDANQPWWYLDIGTSKAVSEIRIWNRTDCCPSRLHDYAVLASPSPITTTSYDSALNSVYAAGGKMHFVPGTSQTLESVLMPTGTSARYFAVYMWGGAEILSLAEFQVIAA